MDKQTATKVHHDHILKYCLAHSGLRSHPSMARVVLLSGSVNFVWWKLKWVVCDAVEHQMFTIILGTRCLGLETLVEIIDSFLIMTEDDNLMAVPSNTLVCFCFLLQ